MFHRRSEPRRLLGTLFHDPWRKPSQEIASHLDGSGSGFELDDLMSRARLPWQHGVIAKIIEIEKCYRSEQYPVGIGNPAARHALRELQRRLEAQGL